MKKLKKIISLGLALSMGLLVYPITEQIQATPTTHSWEVDNIVDDLVWTPMPGTNEGDTRGTWYRGYDSKSDTIQIRSKAKARETQYYYTTSGYTAHSAFSYDKDPESTGGTSIKIPMYNLEDGDAPKPNAPTTVNGDGVYAYGTGEDSTNEWGTVEIYWEVDPVTKTNTAEYQLNKDKIIQALIAEGMDMCTLTPSTSGNGLEVYLSGIFSVHKYEWQDDYYTSVDDFIAEGGQGLYDVVYQSIDNSYNIPFEYPNLTDNIVAYFNLETGERIYFEDLGLIDSSSPTQGTLSSSSIGAQLVPSIYIDSTGKRYQLVLGKMAPHKFLPENFDFSYYEVLHKSFVKMGGDQDEIYKNSLTGLARIDLYDDWYSELSQVGDYGEVFFDNSRSVNPIKQPNGLLFGNDNVNIWGSSILGYYVPIDDSSDGVGYSKTTGEPIIEIFKDDSDKVTFPDILTGPDGKLYELDKTNKREDVSAEDDKVQTKTDVDNGDGVMTSTDLPSSDKIVKINDPEDLARAAYDEIDGIDILYYDNYSGDLIKREEVVVSSTGTYSVKDSVEYMGDTYLREQVSFKLDIDPEVDISTTGSPVMGPDDLGIVDASSITIPPENLTDDYIIRVSMEEPLVVNHPSPGSYIIPAQQLTKEFDFVFPEDLFAKVTEVFDPPVDSHEDYEWDCDGHYDSDGKKYYCSGCEKDWYTCYIHRNYTFDKTKFDWSSVEEDILHGGDLFADMGTTTLMDELLAEGDSWEVSVTPKLHFLSHRIGADGFKPVFAQYKSSANSAAKSYLDSVNLDHTYTEGLVGRTYNVTGGSGAISVSLEPGELSEYDGRKGTLKTTHSSYHCDIPDRTDDVFLPIAEFSNEAIEGEVFAEPLIGASPKPVASKVNSSTVSSDLSKITVYSSPSTIDFYPAFEMFAGGKSAWVLGSLERSFMPVDVHEIEIVNKSVAPKVESMWSRDYQDRGRTVMKGGYTYGVQTQTPMEIKVTSYIHVPKAGYTSDATSSIASRKASHTSVVNQIANTANFAIYSNLPEAYQDDYPAAWKKINPYKKSTDNYLKSRMSQPKNIYSNVGSTSTSTLTLSQLDALHGAKTQSVSRLNGQLESVDWYSEEFDGIEVLKMVTTIKVSYDQTAQVNFVRNGGTSYNDLASPVANIPSNKFGITQGLHATNMNIGGTNVTFNLVTSPFLFDVRGTMYDDMQ